MIQTSLNNKLIVEPIKYNRTLQQASTSSGFAFIKQKENLIKLVLKMDAKIGTDVIKKGTILYIQEEWFFNAKLKTFSVEGSNETYMIVPIEMVDFLETI